MKRSTSKSSSSRRQPAAPAVQLTWAHFGVLHRVTAWPDLRFETQVDGEWTPFTPDPAHERFASGAVMIDARGWQRFLDFMPAPERRFLLNFKTGRLAALAVLASCPGMLADLDEVPAFTAFLAHHVPLRGETETRWATINAVHERDGLFGLLEWLGLPASRQTLSILGHITDADLSRRLLVPLRGALWEPETLWILQHTENLTERELLTRCHALAA